MEILQLARAVHCQAPSSYEYFVLQLISPADNYISLFTELFLIQRQEMRTSSPGIVGLFYSRKETFDIAKMKALHCKKGGCLTFRIPPCNPR